MVCLQDKVFFRLCGVMEYEKALRERAGYRDFMFRTSRYQEVVSFDLCMGSPAQVADVRSACIALYRLRFVRDIILHPKIDDPGITALGSMISFSSTEICAQVSDLYNINTNLLTTPGCLLNKIYVLFYFISPKTDASKHSLYGEGVECYLASAEYR